MTSAASGQDLALVRVVRGRLRSNGDWNINDWKDAARALADQVEGLSNRPNPRKLRRRILDAANNAAEVSP